ncbi:hypothetical protein [Antarcticirhabdus aurantiaca]|uniref:Uncharacterized protein n=1 Tax=Antarcticirhabdus aurantiaca TaxID=2606717 RepID=A0ACD4NMJ3_9HYPH|nr:hypothetical protein [Antarcticirhabdus aurantiaca]WAJ28029.1 hypothetical protein OXU80_24910 [Jeongeuplla avenae]
MTWHRKGILHQQGKTLVYPLTTHGFSGIAKPGDVLAFLESKWFARRGLYLFHHDEYERLATSPSATDEACVGRLVGIMPVPDPVHGAWSRPADYIRARDAQGVFPVLWCMDGPTMGEVYEMVPGDVMRAREPVCPDLNVLAQVLRRQGRIVYGHSMTAHPMMSALLARAIGSERMTWTAWISMRVRHLLRQGS